jgi:hypothetical protein
MFVTEECIADVVSEASAQLHDPKYITGRVDRLMSAQPAVSQYVVAHQAELTVEGVVSVLFHAALMLEAVQRGKGRQVDRLSYAELDSAARRTPSAEALSKGEANLASYIATNLDLDGGEQRNAVARRILAHIAAALVSFA